jgi:hypothetical protein
LKDRTIGYLGSSYLPGRGGARSAGLWLMQDSVLDETCPGTDRYPDGESRRWGHMFHVLSLSTADMGNSRFRL